MWDLSDQDNDGMLSLREFCIALYLMERHREKCPLPAVLPESVRSDQTLLLATNQPLTGYGGPVSQSTPGTSRVKSCQMYFVFFYLGSCSYSFLLVHILVNLC